jgi:hypothetical protein
MHLLVVDYDARIAFRAMHSDCRTARAVQVRPRTPARDQRLCQTLHPVGIGWVGQRPVSREGQCLARVPARKLKGLGQQAPAR